MKSLLLTIILLGIVSYGLTQQTEDKKTEPIVLIYGKILNKNRQAISNARVELIGSKAVTYSDNLGKFSFAFPSVRFSDLLLVTHPNYMPVTGNFNQEKFVMIPKNEVAAGHLSQKKISGEVVDKKTKLPVEDVKILVVRTDFKTKSDSTGQFASYFKGQNYFVFTHPDYFSQYYRPIAPSQFKRFELQSYENYERDSVLIRKKETIMDSIAAQTLNAVYWYPLLLLNAAIGVGYQHYVGKKTALGMSVAYYFKGWGPIPLNEGNSTYNGAKISPFVRFYPKKNTSRKREYYEIAGLIGYYNFYKIGYDWEDLTEYGPSVKFWTGGFSIAAGWETAPCNDRKGFFSISVGAQVFPMGQINKTYNYMGRDYSYSSWWWYIWGPGSILQVKLAVGGIF